MTELIGASRLRVDGPAKVRGAVLYGMDYSEPNMLYGCLLRSPVAAGKIQRLDTSVAQRLPGVVVIVTAADADRLSGWIVKDQPLFAGDHVRFAGEPIAAVAANTLEQAVAAVDAIELQVEPLAPLATMECALAPGARLVHPEWRSYVTDGEGTRDGNVAWENALTRGDVARAFADAYAVIEDSFVAPRAHQSPIEPHCAVARFEGGRYVIHTPTQYPFLVRDRVAELLGVSVSDVRVLATPIGGGFGGKLDAMLEPFCALLAQRTGRPVKILNTRTEELKFAGPRENATVWLRTAVTAEGQILGQEAVSTLDCGAYAGETVSLASMPGVVFGSTMRIPAARYVGRAVYTNTTPTAAFRGVAGPYSVWALGQHLDHIADELQIDRREIRIRNLLRKGDRMVNGQILPDDGLMTALDALEKHTPWREASKRQPPVRSDPATPPPLRGVGLAVTTWLTNPGPSQVTLKLNEDGRIGVVSAAVEIGTGAVVSGLRQIVASEMKVAFESVVMAEPDTDATGYDAGAQGSRTTFGTGIAIQRAAVDLRRQILTVASSMLEANVGDLRLDDGAVHVVGDVTTAVPLAEVAVRATWMQGPIAATASFNAPALAYDATIWQGGLETTFYGITYHAHFAEVEVNPETGHVKVTKYIVVQDVGRAVNPLAIAGQIQGGVVQGLGYSLYEELRLRDGITVEDSLESYRLPTSLDAPDVEMIILEIPFDEGPFGAKGVAEPPIVPVAAAVASAVADAIGVRIHTLPLTPFRVLEALQTKGGTKQ